MQTVEEILRSIVKCNRVQKNKSGDEKVRKGNKKRQKDVRQKNVDKVRKCKAEKKSLGEEEKFGRKRGKDNEYQTWKQRRMRWKLEERKKKGAGVDRIWESKNK